MGGPAGNASERGNLRQYCTQRCLRGLVGSGALDKNCPNVQDHGNERHVIEPSAFAHILHKQLAGSRDVDCEPQYIGGARGHLFKLTLSSHGYTVAAKGTDASRVRYLRHEATVYERLRSLQGKHIPVCLGAIDLALPYHYDGKVIVHMLLLGWAGTAISRKINEDNQCHLVRQTIHALGKIHQLQVLHRDAEPRNILWNEETHRVMIIDFERAALLMERTSLGPASCNRSKPGKDAKSEDDEFSSEVRNAQFSLSSCVNRLGLLSRVYPKQITGSAFLVSEVKAARVSPSAIPRDPMPPLPGASPDPL